ncbi:unnamed protein product [Linum tenue]|uniref:beta-galactosidase n=1 Tax=Linum tenue TaxID=586396 RepID=A0AAV0PD99_9ROSI|nr:unnamed protein product [Linum tenue]
MVGVAAENVTYDGRSLFINGRRHLIISGSIHYPRSTPEMWPELVRLAKEGGANTIETYVFWNGHEIKPDIYNFEGRFDLVKFVRIVQEAGMFLILRIGPFVAGEWNFGGIPVWLHFIPGTSFRTENDNFKYYMEKFMTYIVNLMKQEKLFASQGEKGPIIMTQVENEFEYLEQIYPEGKNYVNWAGEMAISQHTSVPWIMCGESDAPGPVIGTCNDFYCDDFQLASDKPKIWTENWTGWLPTYWAPKYHRPSRDSAFAVARFFQKGGSVVNYYMYHGGTNFGRTGGGGFTTSYDFDGPIDEYGLVRFPKWGHLKELHEAIKLCENVVLNTNQPTNIAIGPSQEGTVWGDPSSKICVAFLANYDNTNDATVVFQNASYDIPAWSVSILPDCKNVVFNTAKVSSQSSVVEMVPEDLKPSQEKYSSSNNPLKWEVFVEKAGIWGKEADLVYNGLVDQLNVTKDASDYLWYTTSIDVGGNEEFMKDGSQLALVIQFQSHHLHAFVNGELLNKG